MQSLSQQCRTRSQKSSMPEKPFKVGKFNKKLIGRAIRVGYIDGPEDEGIITGTDLFGNIQFFVPKAGAIGSVDIDEQIIALGEAKVELRF